MLCLGIISLNICILQNVAIFGNSDNVWFILLILSIEHNIWYIADADSYVWVKLVKNHYRAESKHWDDLLQLFK